MNRSSPTTPPSYPDILAEIARQVAPLVGQGRFGDFSYRVGLPGKSGVGGGIVSVPPGELGFCAWSPGLDASGSSLAGSKALELFTTLTGSSIF